MRNRIPKLLWAASLFIAICGTAYADGDFKAPTLTGPVVDQVGVISGKELMSLESDLRALSQSGKAQIAVLVASSLQGLSIEQYGIQLAEAWKIGSKQKEAQDRGAIFIIAPNERKMRIEVGYGLEGEMPDATTFRILEEIVKPAIRRNRMSDGIYAGVRAMITIAEGKPGEDAAVRPGRRDRGEPADAQIFHLLPGFLILLVLGAFGKIWRALLVGGVAGILFMPAMLYGLIAGLIAGLVGFGLSKALMSAGGGGFGGFGGDWGGSGGGGGFSGGGGSFGGGGSSSDW